MDRVHSVQVKTHSVRLRDNHRCSRDVRLRAADTSHRSVKNGRPDTLPIFGMPCRAEVEAPQPKQFEVGNHRARKRQARIDKLPVMFEYACSPESNMGRVFEGLGIPHVRLAKEFIDLSTDEASCSRRLKVVTNPSSGLQFPAHQVQHGNALIRPS